MATLRQYRRLAAREVGPFHASTASTSSTLGALVDDTWPVKSNIAQDSFYLDQHLYRPDAAAASDKRRLVKEYTPASGTLTPDLSWSVAPASGEVFELLGLFDPDTLHDYINQALKSLMVVVEATLTPTADRTRHALTTPAPWLRDERWVYAVGWLYDGESRDEVNPFARIVHGTVERDGGTFYLNHPRKTFKTTDTLYLRLLKPAYEHCKPTAGAFGDQAGLSLETDECVANEEWVAAATLEIAWRRHARLLEQSAAQAAVRDRADATDWLARLTRENFSEPARTLYHGPRLWGPRR